MTATTDSYDVASGAPRTPPAQMIKMDPFREPPGAPKPLTRTRKETSLISVPWGERLVEATPSKRKQFITPGSAEDQYGPLLSERSRPSKRHQGLRSLTGLPSLTPYRYDPLDYSKSQIRLLVLYAGPFEDEVSCRLEHCTLGSNISFDALSYTWGDLNDVCHIQISGKHHQVTSNLESALRHLRSKDSHRMLWVDALCINQNDVRERNHQVQEMKKLYSSARRVLAWTGTTQVGSDRVMSKMREVFTREVEISHFNTLSLYALTSRSYWSRIWVAQEIAVANKAPLIIAGVQSVSCSAFNLIFSNFRVDLPPMASFLSLRDRFRNEKEIDLASLLFLTSHTQATDPRDMVYALLGLAREADREAIVPDYSKAFEHVCKEVVRHLVHHDLNLKILSRKTSIQSATLPSWVPDFSTAMSPGELWQSDNLASYAASGSTIALAHFSDDMSTVRLEGSCVDTIMYTFGPFKNGNDIIDLLPSVIQEMKHYVETVLNMKNPLENDRIIASTLYSAVQDRTKHPLEPLARSESEVSGYRDPNREIAKTATIAFMVCDALVRTIYNQSAWTGAELDTQSFAVAGEHRPHFSNRWKPFRSALDIKEDGVFKPRLSPERFPAFRHWDLLITKKSRDSGDPWQPDPPQETVRAAQPLVETLVSRNLFITKAGFIGIGPKALQPGDQVCLLHGGDVFYIVRQNFGQHHFVGDAYVHNAMNGELLHRNPVQEFILR